MDPFSFAPIAALLNAAYLGVQALATLFPPAAAGALAIVALTVIVRSALIPVGISQVKAEWTRRRIAPKLRALQQKHKKNPELLQRKTAALYKAENVSPFAGMLPTLAQAPVLSLVYALFIRTTVDGHPNALLTEHLLGVPLGASVFTAGWPGVLVFAGLFAVMGVTAWLSRRTALRVATESTRLTQILSWMPFLTIAFAALVPLAAGIYLATTTAWTLGERALLRRRYWGDVTGGVPAVAG